MNIYRLLFSGLLAFSLISCSNSDDDDSQNNQPDLSFITGAEGCQIEVKIDNLDGVTYSGQNVLGWDTSQLLSTNYMTQLRLTHDGFPTLNIRFFVESGISVENAVVGENGLIGMDIPLQDTESLSGSQAHMFIFENSETTSFTGTLEIRQNVVYLDTVLDMVGTFEITSGNRTITGGFWKQDVSQW
ncbi:MAG: hypothetical protein AAF688_10335 [Bacteroidota bacterium]